MKTEEVQNVFFRVCIEAAVQASYVYSAERKTDSTRRAKMPLNARPLEALSKLIVVLIKMAG
eukprot:Pgem_evm1s14970